MARQRDYKAEYQRRLASATKRGLSRSQARGHARSGEAPIKSKPAKSDKRLEDALKILREHGNQSRAAKESGVSPERLRRFLRDNSLAERTGGKWRVTDNRPRRMTVYSEGQARLLTLRDYEQSSLNGQHLAAVREFLTSQKRSLLKPFEGRSVIDVKGEAHPLETDPDELYRIAAQGGEPFHDVYRLIV